MIEKSLKLDVLIICYSNLKIDPRVLRQIEFLGKTNSVTTAGLHPSEHENEIDFVKINLDNNRTYVFHYNYPKIFRKMVSLFYVLPKIILNKIREYYLFKVVRNYEKHYWNAQRLSDLDKLSLRKFSVVISNDIDTLPIAIRIKERTGAKVYFDAHEYSPLEYENDHKWLKYNSPYLIYLCKKYIPCADYCTTVGLKIAEEYKNLTGKSFDVVYNSPEYQHLPINSGKPSPVRCVHHGVASPIRKVESLINAFIELGAGFELNLLLVINDKKYFRDLRKLAKGHSNVIFHNPVPTADICSFINQFDISLIFIPPVNFNYKYCLPNKFFESIQARLMILCGPSEEMIFLTKKYDLGIISQGFETADIKASLEDIKTEDILAFKSNADIAAGSLGANTIMNNLRLQIDQLMKLS
jgi:hypothetical protein